MAHPSQNRKNEKKCQIALRLHLFETPVVCIGKAIFKVGGGGGGVRQFFARKKTQKCSIIMVFATKKNVVFFVICEERNYDKAV